MNNTILLPSFSWMRRLGHSIGLSVSSVLLACTLAAEAPVTLQIDIDRPVLPADSNETAVVKVAVDGMRPVNLERAPVNLALVIDRSGSMNGQPLHYAKEAAIAAVRRLASDDVVSVIVYDHEASVLVRAGRVGDGYDIVRRIDRITSRGNTNLYGGVELGARELRRYLNDRRIHRVVLLSDGKANVGPSSASELGRLGADLVREGISVTTIGLGLGYNEDLMTRLAMRSDGNTYFVANGSDLPRIFAEELGDVLNVVAREVLVEIRFPMGVRPVRVVGREGRVEDRRVTVELNQLYGGHQKFALIEVEVDPHADEAAIELAEAEVRYTSVLDERDYRQQARANVTFSRSEKEVVAHANQTVQTDYARNRIAEAKDRMVELADAGRRDEAAGLLSSVSSWLGSMADSYSNADVKALEAEAASEAKRVESEGINNEQRKAYRAENAQTVRQQRAN